MKKLIKSDTFSNDNLLALMNAIQGGNAAIEEKLYKAIGMNGGILEKIASGWEKTLGTESEDLIQDCFLHVLKKLRGGGLEIPNGEAWLRLVTENYLRNKLKEKKAKKRAAGKDPATLDDSIEADPALGELSEDLKEPDEIYERRENEGIAKSVREIMDNLSAELRAGIEKSLDLIADLFRTRSILQDRLKRGSRHDRLILKAIGAIKKARAVVAQTCRPAPRDEDLMRLYELRELSPPLCFSGIPEKDAEVDARLAEETGLWEKYGTAYLLFEVQRKLSAEILNPELELLLTPGYLLDDFDYKSPWIDHLSEIFKMKVSPLNFIDKVWSRAPEFRKPGSGKYRNRRAIELILYAYKKRSKGTDREFLFSSIKDRSFTNIKELSEELQHCRKAGYGYALKKKFRPIIDLIYRESFGKL